MMHKRVHSVRDVLLLHPYQLPLVATLAVLALVFTFWPDALQHSPIAFERRGLIHHVWHYTLLAGALFTLYALVIAPPPRKLLTEVVGILALSSVITLNLIAQVASQTTESPESGLGIALRVAVLIGFAVRVYSLLRQPTVQVSIEQRPEG